MPRPRTCSSALTRAWRRLQQPRRCWPVTPQASPCALARCLVSPSGTTPMPASPRVLAWRFVHAADAAQCWQASGRWEELVRAGGTSAESLAAGASPAAAKPRAEDATPAESGRTAANQVPIFSQVPPGEVMPPVFMRFNDVEGTGHPGVLGRTTGAAPFGAVLPCTGTSGHTADADWERRRSSDGVHRLWLSRVYVGACTWEGLHWTVPRDQVLWVRD